MVTLFATLINRARIDIQQIDGTVAKLGNADLAHLTHNSATSAVKLLSRAQCCYVNSLDTLLEQWGHAILAIKSRAFDQRDRGQTHVCKECGATNTGHIDKMAHHRDCMTGLMLKQYRDALATFEAIEHDNTETY